MRNKTVVSVLAMLSELHLDQSNDITPNYYEMMMRVYLV